MRDLLYGIPADQIPDQEFLDQWSPVVGNNLDAEIAVILRERLNWVDEKRLQEEPLAM